MFENAKWITGKNWPTWRVPSDEEMGPCPLFTKGFTVTKPVKSAVLSVVGLGQAVYYLNGQRIDGCVRPTHPASFTKTVIYNVYDVASYLKSGSNRIGAILGNIGYNDPATWRSNVKLLLQLDITYEDGDAEQIVSDTSFKTADSHVLYSRRLCGEKQDTNMIIKGCFDADFDDVQLARAEITKAPGGKLRTTNCPPVCQIGLLEGKEIAPGIYDFGINTSGHVRLKVKGTRGAEVSIRYSEKLTPDGLDIDNDAITNKKFPMFLKDVFILDGTEQVLEQLFSYHGFRYVKIEGNADIYAVTGVIAHNKMEKQAEFWCDNEIINAIHKATVNSLLTNCHGFLTDCPTREQNPWTGDGMLSSEAMNINIDAYDLFYEWMLKFQDDQFASGGLPCLIPMRNGIWEYNFANGPDWDSAIFHIPYYTFKYTGNRQIVDLMWENMCRSLTYFATLSENCLLSAGIGDWSVVGEKCPVEITDTAYYRKAALMMAEMAENTDRDPAQFLQLAGKIKADFRDKYVKDGHVTYRGQTAIAAAIYGEFLEAAELETAVNDLKTLLQENDYRFLLGAHGLNMIFDALSEHGQSQVLFDTVTNPKYEGYAKCIQAGLTTLPESFYMDSSLNHHFFSPVDAWFYKHLAGIKLEGLTGGKVVIQPKFVDGINHLKANFKQIQVAYTPEKLEVVCPYDFTLVLGRTTQELKAGTYSFAR